MSRKIVVVNPRVNQDQKNMLSNTASKYGASIEFYDEPKDAMDHIEDAEIIYGNAPVLIKNAPNLKWFCSASAGIDHYIRAGAFEGRDIILTNSSGSYGVSISEHIIMVSLMMMRRMRDYDKIIANHQWRSDLAINSLHGSNIVVLGTGNLGQVFAKRVRGFEPKSVTGVSRSGNPVDGFDKVVDISQLDDLLPTVDLLVMCLPGTPETVNIMSKERIALLPETAFVVNVGRGSAVDQEAIVEALKAGKLAGVSLDVANNEPLREDDPLWDVEELLLTPHISGQENLPWTRDNNFNMFNEDLENYFEGRELSHLADITKGY